MLLEELLVFAFQLGVEHHAMDDRAVLPEPIGLAFAWPSSESILAAPAWASSVQIIAREPKIEFTAHEWALADLRNPWVNGGVRMSASSFFTLSQGDVEAIRSEIPEVQYISGSLRGSSQVVYAERNWNSSWQGVDADYLVINGWVVREGAGFDVEVVEHFEVVGDEADGDEQQAIEVAGSVQLIDAVAHVGFEPRLLRGTAAALVDELPARQARAFRHEA